MKLYVVATGELHAAPVRDDARFQSPACMHFLVLPLELLLIAIIITVGR